MPPIDPLRFSFHTVHKVFAPLGQLYGRGYSVEQQLQQLSRMERTILVLYHQEERSYEQIAESLQLPIGTVRTHLHRGRKKLREAIQRQQTTGRGTAWQKTR